jgi:ABC-2 type transport system permease protein
MSTLPARPSWSGRWRKWLQNPVTVKELRSRMRGRRAFVVLTIYLLLLSGFLSLIYLAFASASQGPYGPTPQDAGKTLFGLVVAVQLFLALFIGPALTAGAITGEKERQTYDLLLTTLIPARALLGGKLLSGLSYLFLLIFAAVPLQSIAFLLGGVSLAELVVSQLLIAVGSVTFAVIGLFFSARVRSTLVATVATYTTVLAALGVVPILGVLTIFILETACYNCFSGTPSLALMATLVYGAFFLAATNLPLTIIISEFILLEEDALFYFLMTPGPGIHSLWVISPWVLNVILYLLLTLLLYWTTVRRLRQVY